MNAVLIIVLACILSSIMTAVTTYACPAISDSTEKSACQISTGVLSCIICIGTIAMLFMTD